MTSYPNQAVYIGHKKNEKKEGSGRYIWPEGCSYDGNWKDDKMEGNGVFTQVDGTQL
jgi:hypothetical protein